MFISRGKRGQLLRCHGWTRIFRRKTTRLTKLQRNAYRDLLQACFDGNGILQDNNRRMAQIVTSILEHGATSPGAAGVLLPNGGRLAA